MSAGSHPFTSLRTVLAGHSPAREIVQLWTSVHRLESTVRYLGIEVDDALDIAEQIDV